MKHPIDYTCVHFFFERRSCLSKADHEGNHEREQAGGLSEGETQNGVLEQLAPQARVASGTGDQRTEDGTDTHTGTSQTNCRQTSTDLLAGFDESVGELGGVRAEGLTGEGTDGGGLEDLLTLCCLEGRLGSIVVLEGSTNTCARDGKRLARCINEDRYTIGL